jgi:hypothetical protein
MTNPLRSLWAWTFRRGGGFDYSFSCLGATGLTILLSERVWSEWLRTPHGPLLQFALTCWPSCLGLLAVWAIEARQVRSRMLATGHSAWWTAPLILTIIGLAACPPALGSLRVLLVLIFIAPQVPIFVDRSQDRAVSDGKQSHNIA